MSLNTIFPILLTSAATGLTCGLSCGACGNPMVNLFLATYLFTHSGRLKRSLISFIGFHLGKAVTVTGLCALISIFGSQVVDDKGKLFGISLQDIVYVAMFFFMIVMIFRWFKENKIPKEHSCDGSCSHAKSDKFYNMLVYGLISGMSPCASLVVALGYASTLTTTEAILVGLCFSLANSVIPLVVLTILTGLLSKEMYSEISTKIRYFQLMTYIVFAAALAYKMIIPLWG